MLVSYIFINGVKSQYTIDEHAAITNTDTNQILNGWIEKRGYRAVTLKDPSSDTISYVRRTVHRLMAETFIPNPDNLPVVNHKDGNKLNNELSNLEWASYKWNYDHARSIGLIKTGDSLSYATVDNETVHRICKMLEDGYRNIDIINAIGLPNDRYGKSLITRIRIGKGWKDISSQYDFVKTGSLKKIPDELIHEVCKRLEKKYSLKEIYNELGLTSGFEYHRLKSLVYDIRSKRCHKTISSQYHIS